MNYGLFHQWVLDRVDELVEMGVSRREANHLMTALELGAIADEARNRAERQFLLDYERTDAKVMAERHRKSEAWVRKRARKARQLVATPVAG
ncbi:hypothetical protein [Noviluteimonas gilva]|uniref:Uncharacterized protein n=1 Tax=Noviluteimonas gilva TaxID=2682097 RepID=A0A7C9LG16_9GAMM|nr:hypothetical protein [Lysobacter gilvus]MUV13561.1 hypothetical protein [Lysobacter gilvus]